jgi:hypothetical protein
MSQQPTQVLTVTDFPKCPVCHCKETVTQKALEMANVEVPTGNVPKLATEMLPLEQPLLAGVLVKVLVAFYDVCLKCGTRYCVHAEIIKAPTVPMGQKPPGRN